VEGPGSVGVADAPGNVVVAPVVDIEPRRGFRRLGLSEVWEYRHLLWFFTLRTIRGRYRPTLLGRGWILFRPILLSMVYILVFGVMLRITTEPIPFPLFVFTGIVVFQFFSAGVMETANSLISNYSIMSKVYYPRLIVPLTSVMVNAVDLVATIVVVVVMMAAYRIVPDWRLLPLVVLFLLAIALATLAVGVILAALAVRVRDVLVALPVVMRVLIYSMPVAYPVTLVPEAYRSLYYLNPMSAYLQGVRWALLNDAAPPTWALLLGSAMVVSGLLVGLCYFSVVERTMVDRL
jgi:lipopolysaccharide transport system permease protein